MEGNAAKFYFGRGIFLGIALAIAKKNNEAQKKICKLPLIKMPPNKYNIKNIPKDNKNAKYKFPIKPFSHSK